MVELRKMKSHMTAIPTDWRTIDRVRLAELELNILAAHTAIQVTSNGRGRAPLDTCVPLSASTAASRSIKYYGQKNACRRHTPGGNPGSGAGWNSPPRI